MEDVMEQGIRVKLGGAEYTVRALPIDRDGEWRKQVGDFVANMTRHLDRNNPSEFMAEVMRALAGEDLEDLLQTMWMLEWEPRPLPLGESVSRAELTRAMVEVFKAHYVPFVESLKDLMLLLV